MSVKRTVGALPFTAEGYNRAKSISQEKFGKESEIVKAYTKEILGLASIPSASPKKIGEFSEKLTYCVQALQTMNKLEQVNGAVSMTLDKLPAIRGDLVRTDPGWESWDFSKLSEAIRLWTRRNPVDTTRSEQEQPAKQIHGQPRCTMLAEMTTNSVVACIAVKTTKLWNAIKLPICQIGDKFCSISVYVSIAYLVAIARHIVPANRPVNVVASVTTRRFVKQLTRHADMNNLMELL